MKIRSFDENNTSCSHCITSLDLRISQTMFIFSILIVMQTELSRAKIYMKMYSFKMGFRCLNNMVGGTLAPLSALFWSIGRKKGMREERRIKIPLLRSFLLPWNHFISHDDNFFFRVGFCFLLSVLKIQDLIKLGLVSEGSFAIVARFGCEKGATDLCWHRPSV